MRLRRDRGLAEVANMVTAERPDGPGGKDEQEGRAAPEKKSAAQQPALLCVGSRLAHQRLQAGHGLAQADEHGPRDDGVSDVQLPHPRQRRDGLHVEVVQAVSGVEAHAGLLDQPARFGHAVDLATDGRTVHIPAVPVKGFGIGPRVQFADGGTDPGRGLDLGRLGIDEHAGGDAGITTSVFIDAEPAQVEAAARVGASVCELHTGPYAEAFHRDGRDVDSPAIRREIDRVAEAGRLIQQAGMRFNAGHGLNYFNVQPIAALPGVRELHIGHAIVSRAVFVGLREAVASLKALMREAAADAQQRRLLRG